MLAKWTVDRLKNIDPRRRLIFAAWLFWFSIAGCILSAPIAYFAQGWFGLILMVISWLAVTFTAWDIILTADVREEEGNNGSSEETG